MRIRSAYLNKSSHSIAAPSTHALSANRNSNSTTMTKKKDLFGESYFQGYELNIQY